ncbi:MAG: CCA tRNA nucleotidyltransferase [Bacillota bacterium]
MRIVLPEAVEQIISALESRGYQAYAVGGCVRDSIMGRAPSDWDIATAAKPAEVKELFSNTVDTGLKHGTVTVIIDSIGYEVTTFRFDGEYIDSRHPNTVVYTESLTNDLSRRDFTINAIAYNYNSGMVDPFDGLSDIGKKLIRAVGDPQVRFSEDALRMLRAVRFSAQLDFDIDEAAIEAIKYNYTNIGRISFERIREELNKLLLSDKPSKIDLLKETGLLKIILPELNACYNTEQRNPYHIYNVAEHIISSVSHIDKNLLLRWVMLLHDIGKPLVKTTDSRGIHRFSNHEKVSAVLAENILKRLRFDTAFIEDAVKLIQFHSFQLEPDIKSVRKAMSKLGEQLFLQLIKVKRADMLAHEPYLSYDRLNLLDYINILYKQIISEGQCFNLKSLAVNGKDLLNAGFKEEKRIGNILDSLLNIVIDDPSMNNKDALLKEAEKIKYND